MKKMFMDADMGGTSGGATGGKIKFSASAVNPKIDSIINYKNEIYSTLSALTKEIDSKVSNDSAETVMGGAVGDLKSDWAAFQTEYNNFSNAMDNIKAALIKAGDSYDTFNKSITAASSDGTDTSSIYG